MNTYISNIQYYCTHDGPGIRTTVFFMGCTMKCSWCHNPECSIYTDLCKSEESPICGKNLSVEEVFEAVKADQVFYGKEGGITCSGGEPLLQYEFVKELFSKCHSSSISTAIETSLCISWSAVQSIISLTDLWIVDLKCISPEKHFKFTGRNNDVIYDNLQRLLHTGKNIWIRMPIIPGVQTEEDIRGMISWIKQVPNIKKVELIPFHLLGQEKYRKLNVPCPYPSNTEPEEKWMKELSKIVCDAGLPLEK